MTIEKEGMDALGNAEREQLRDDAVDCALIQDLFRRVEDGEIPKTARLVFFLNERPFKEKKKIKKVPIASMSRENLRVLFNGVTPDGYVELSAAGSGEVIVNAVGNLTVNLAAKPRLQHILPPGMRVRRNKARKRKRKPWMRKQDDRKD